MRAWGLNGKTAVNNIEELYANIKAYQQTDVAKLWQKTRRLLGYGVNALAAELGTSGAQISRIESGEREPSAELIIKFSQLKEQKMSNVRFLTDDEIESFPGIQTPEIAVLSSDGNEYYGEVDWTQTSATEAHLEAVIFTDKNGDYIPVK